MLIVLLIIFSLLVAGIWDYKQLNGWVGLTISLILSPLVSLLIMWIWLYFKNKQVEYNDIK